MDYNQEINITWDELDSAHKDSVTENGLDPNVSDFERGLSFSVGAILILSSVKNFKKTPIRAMLRAAIGTGLIIRGSSGICPAYRKLDVDGRKTTAVNVRTTFVVNKPRNEVYQAWRNLGTLPKFMRHLKNVTQYSDTRSHWEAHIPEGNPVGISWDAEIVKDEHGEMLSWRSLPGASIENAGKVEFRDALGHHGTEVRVFISYRPPAGNIGAGVGKLLTPLFRKILKEDIQGFKQYIELHNGIADGFR